MRSNAKSAAVQRQTDYWLLSLALLFASFGLVMVLSASGVMAERFYQDKYLFFRKQAFFCCAGALCMLVVARLPRGFFHRFAYFWLFAAVALLALTLTPLGVSAGGASRWLKMGAFSIQPLEFSKLALVLYLAYFFSRKQHMIKSFSVGFLPPFLVTGALCLLLLHQPDFGGAMFLADILFFMCLVGGTRFSYLLLALFVGTAGAWHMIVSSPYRFKRLLAFLDPFETAANEGYQLVQSLYAFGSGQIFGAGLGAGKQKLFFLPEAHNDFIMAVVGEELGFFGVSGLFIILGLFLWRAFRVALVQEDLRDRLTAYGAALILALGFFLNLAVVMGLAPPKGVPMPFVSYGGSSLLASFLCVGILLNLSRGVRS
ncbi:MAG: putative lipid II flippase FtsW [Desulfovibrionaceae bacterium]